MSYTTGVDPFAAWSSQFQTETYKVKYITIGSGPTPIFAFPGVMAPLASSFVPLVNHMLKDAEFCATYTFYGWDQPGYFGSKFPLRKKEHISFDIDVEIAHTLLKHLSTEKYIIWGYSGGCQTAILFCQKYPQMVGKMILAGGFDRFEEQDVKLNAWYRNLANVSGPFAQLLKDDFKGEEALMYEHWEGWHDMILGTYSNQDKESWNARYENFKTPTLIVWGQRDLIVPFRQTKELHGLIQNSRLAIVPKAPHNIHYVFPQEFLDLVKNFMDEKFEDKLENGGGKLGNGKGNLGNGEGKLVNGGKLGNGEGKLDNGGKLGNGEGKLDNDGGKLDNDRGKLVNGEGKLDNDGGKLGKVEGKKR